MSIANQVWIIIAAYNEEKALPGVLAEFQSTPYQVVVVDDGSTDATAEVALRYPVTLLRHVTNLGQGAALQTGISYAVLQPGTQAVVTFDADGQHQVADLPRLLAPIEAGDVDVCLGSRFLPGAQAIHMPFSRRLMLRGALILTRLTSGLRLTDTHNGLRAFKLPAARQLQLTYNRMAHASEILARISERKLRYCEVPVTIRYTHYSLTKGQSILESVNVLWDMLSARMR